MRLGRVTIDLGYVVDMDNLEMVEHAKRCIYDDVMTADVNQELQQWITVLPDKKATKGEIPEFLLEDHQ